VRFSKREINDRAAVSNWPNNREIVRVDFKKAYDSIHRDSLYNIMDEVGIPKKLIGLTKMCIF
jgi:hypothetical protein